MPDIFDQISAKPAPDIFDKLAASGGDIFDQLAAQQPRPTLDLTRVAPPQNLTTNQFIVGSNGGGQGFTIPTAKEAGQVMGTAGRMLSGGLADVGETITGQPSRENFDAAVAGEPMPMTQEAKLLPAPLRIAERASQGLVESVPKLAAVAAIGELAPVAAGLGVPLKVAEAVLHPLAAGAVFGTTEEGFDPKAAFVGAALPFVGKYSGEIAGAIAQRFGVDSPTALNWVKGLAGTAVPAAGVIADQEHTISQLPTDQQHEAQIEMWANVAGQLALGPMGVKFDHEGAATERDIKAMRNNPQYQQAVDEAARNNLSPENATYSENPNPQPPVSTYVGPAMLDALDEMHRQIQASPSRRRLYGMPAEAPLISTLLQSRLTPTETNVSDLDIAQESNQSIAEKHPVGPLRDAAMTARRKAAVRVASTAQDGDVLVRDDGTRVVLTRLGDKASAQGDFLGHAEGKDPNSGGILDVGVEIQAGGHIEKTLSSDADVSTTPNRVDDGSDGVPPAATVQVAPPTGAATQEPTPVAAAKATGFTFDGTFQSPNGPAWQFTLRGLPPDDPRFGATFYTPVDAPLQDVVQRANDKVAEFQAAATSKPNEGNAPQLAINPTSPAFSSWFGNSKAVTSDGTPRVFYHGTSSGDKITSFRNDVLNPRALFGPGHYFTASSRVAGGDETTIGYAKKGMLTSDFLHDEYRLQDGESWESAEKKLKAQAVADGEDGESLFMHRSTTPEGQKWIEVYNDPIGSPSVVPVYLKAERPLEIDSELPNWESLLNKAQELHPDFDFSYSHDRLHQIEGFNAVIGDNFYNALRKATDENENFLGKVRANEILRELGFDSIFHEGGGRRRDGNERHDVVIVFDPTQIKSAIGNKGTFDPKNTDIALSIDRGGKNDTVPGGESSRQLPPSPVSPQRETGTRSNFQDEASRLPSGRNNPVRDTGAVLSVAGNDEGKGAGRGGEGGQGDNRNAAVQRQSEDAGAVGLLHQSFNKYFGWTTPLEPAPIRFGSSKESSPESLERNNQVRAVLEETLGRKIVGVRSNDELPWGGVNISENPRTLYLNIDSSEPMHFLVGHEFGESLRLVDPELFASLFNEMVPLMRGVERYRDRINTLYRQAGLPEMALSKAYKEAICDFIGDEFGKPEFWDALANKNPSLFYKAGMVMRDLLTRIINALNPFRSEPYVTDIAKARQVIVDAINRHTTDEMVKASLRKSQGDTGTQFAIEPFKSSKDFNRMANAPGVSPEGRDKLENLAQVQSGDVEAPLRERIVTRAFTEPTTQAERVARGLVKKTADLITTHDVPRDFASITDPIQKETAAVIVTQRHLAIQGEQAKIERFQDDATGQVEAAVKAMANYSSTHLGSDMLAAMASQLPKDYTQYLDNLQRTDSENANLQAAARSLKQRAGRQVGDFLVSHGAIEKALQEIADNRSIKTGAEVEPSPTGATVYHPSPSNKEFLNRVRFAGPLKGVNDDANLLLLGGPGGKGLGGVDPLLARIKDLPDKIAALRKINDGASKAMREITDFQSGFNPQGKAVGVSTAMKRYASLILKSKAADTILKTLDANYGKARERLLGAAEAHGLVGELLDAPGYKKAVQDASGVIGLQFANALSPVDGEFRTTGPYPENKHDYIITRTPTKEAAAQNQVEVQGLLSDIEKFLDDPAADPVQKQSWSAVHDFVKAQWLENIFAPIEHPDQRDPFDWQHWSVILNPTRTQQGLIRDMIGGRETYDLRRSMDALDFIRGKLQTLELDPKRGVASITLRMVEGAKSHNLDLKSNPLNAEQYRAQILNPIADSLQHFGAVALKVGDYIPGTSTKVTTEDMRALQALSDFEQGTRKIIEKDAQDIFATGTKIMDEYGGVKFSRNSTPTGPMMMTRYWNDDVGNWIRDNWRVGMTGNQREAQIAKLTNAMWNDNDMFGRVVRGYVFETNPDFSKLSTFAKEFRQLAADARKNSVPVNTLDDLVDAIAPMRPDVTRDELAVALKKDLEREAVRVMDNAAGEIAADLNPKGNTAIDRAVASSLKTGGAFLDPRGKMLAPQTFYTIAKIAKSDVMTNPAMAVTIGRVRVLQGMKELLASYAKYQGTLEEQMRAAEVASGSPKSRQEKIDALAQAAKLGDVRYDWPLLNRRIAQLRQQIKFSEETLTKFSELFTPGISRTATTLNRGLTMQLLSSPGAVMQNLLGASYIQDVVMSGLFKGVGAMASSPFGVTKEFARVCIDRTLRLMQKTNPGLTSAISQLVPFKNEIADWLTENQDMAKRLTESGQLPPADVLNRIAAKRAVGFGGEILHPGTEIPNHLQAMQWAFSTPAGLMHEMMFPRAFDNFANTVMGHRATSIMLNIFSHTQDVVDARLASGAKLDSANPLQAIAPKELGMSGEQMKNFRQLLEPIGTLENMMFDYGQRLKAAKAAGTPAWEVPIMDEAKMGAALLAFGKLGNVLSETNTPVVYRMNRVYRILGTFGSWPVNFVNQLSKLIPTKMNSSADGVKLLRLAAATTAVAGLSIAIQEIRRQFMESYTGKLSGIPTLANVASDPASPDAARYLLGAMSGGIPYLGTMLGQNTDTQSLFDASRVVPLLGLFKDTASMAVDAIKTGDVSKSLIDWSNRYLPFYSAAINRLPAVAPYIEAKNVSRSLRAATPSSIEVRSISGGGTVHGTPMNRYLRQAETAAFAGNTAAAQSSINQAIQYKMQTKGISRAEAMNELRQSVGARQPEQRVFGRTLAPTERAQILGRMSAGQLASYHSGVHASQSLLSLLPHQTVSKKKSLFKGVSFQQKKRKLRFG